MSVFGILDHNVNKNMLIPLPFNPRGIEDKVLSYFSHTERPVTDIAGTTYMFKELFLM